MSDVDDLIRGVEDERERERLRRVHELLLTVDAPAESAAPAAPVLSLPRRSGGRLALLAAALAAVSFGAGWLAGDRVSAPEPEREITMQGVGKARGASATIELLPQDESGNWPMRVLVRGLEPSADREDFYELWLTKDGKLAASCGRFTVHEGVTTVTLSVPYGLRRFDEWVVTRAGSDEILLTT